MIKEAGEARAEIVRKLQAGEYVEFMNLHSPIEAYLQSLRQGTAGRLDVNVILGFGNLATFMQSLEGATIIVDPTGRVATFTQTNELDTPPALPSRYGPAESVATAGYGKDLMAAIQAAHDDLKAEKFAAFTAGMFPLSTIHMMQVDGRWDVLQDSLSSESPLVQRMLKDLGSLKDQKAKITGETAEFELPNIVTIEIGRKGKEFERGTRRIRFSLINGSWRFYDATAQVSAELDAAMARSPGSESATALLVLEKIGSDWRLREMPRNPIPR